MKLNNLKALLIVASLLIVLPACGETQEKPATDTSQQSSTEQESEDILVVKFNKEKFMQEMQAQLDRTEAKSQERQQKTETRSGRAKERAQQKLAELRTRYNATLEKYEQFKKSSGEALNELWQGVQDAADELNKAYDEAASQFE